MSPGPKKILYVEDNPVNRLLVRRVLTNAGYVLLEAEDGLAGIQVAQEERPDLILMDIMIPGMDGYQVTTKLKSLPELANTPIVALTAKVMEEDRKRALIAGCDGYIPKPIDVDRLPHQVAEYLGGKQEEIQAGAEERLVLQREYSQELVSRLEEKVRELQKANRELRRTDELKSKFISMAAHELKTPLTVFQGYLTMLVDARGQVNPGLDAAFHGSIQGMARGLERLNTIVEEMLDITRIEGGRLELHRQLTVVKDTVTAAVRKLEPAARERSQTVLLDSLDGLPYIKADSGRLQQVFLNLMSNAIKYTPDGGKITVSARLVQDVALTRQTSITGVSGQFVEVIFEDTGIGISEEDQERIFGRFYEVRDVELHSTSKTRFLGGGLGLGLSIARGIVEAHGGFLWAESSGCDAEKCPGSRFHVLLPVEPGVATGATLSPSV
ncbi:MAG: hybrid sensor histidine kinase/response regulator [Chloroflexota bacterium]